LKDYGDKVSADDKANIEKELVALKEVIKTNDVEKIKPVMESLQTASHKLAEEMYKASAAQQAQGQSGGEAQAGPDGDQTAQDSEAKGPNKEEVVDADFTAEDDKKEAFKYLDSEYFTR